jgi:uncharacterized protein (TIGR03437 family)
MKFAQLAVLTALIAPSAGAVVVTFGTSTSNLVLSGTGLNASGAGTSRVTLGTCNYDGTNTTCVLSGPYTGLGSGGTWAFTLIYPGNGQSPLSAITNPPTSNLFTLSLTAGSFAFTLTPTGGSPVTFYDTPGSVTYSNPTCTVVSQCGVAAVGQAQGSSITGLVTGSADVTPKVNSVITAGNYGGFSAIAPATWIEIYGTNLATVQPQTWASADFNGSLAPTALGGTSVTVNGQPAYVDYVSPHQVNVQVPSGVATGKQTVVVTTFGGPSAGTSVTVNATEPGMLAPPAFDVSAGQYVVATQPNGATFILPPGLTNAVPTARAVPGNVIVMYGIGFGPVSPNINAGAIVGASNALNGVTFTIGGKQATVQFAGLVSGFLGLYQFNVVVPQISANDATPVVVSLNGQQVPQSLILSVGN